MDIIFIRELRIETLIGVHPWERQTRRDLLLDLELGTDIRRAAASDRLADTLDYQAVAQRIAALAATSDFSWWRLWPNASRSRCCGNSPRPGCG